MYHYVRNNEDYSYDCYCRRTSEFESQIDFLSSRFEIVPPGDIEKIEYYLQKEGESACLLSFDDGYKEHYACAKYLKSKGLSGIFFPPINSINGELLDVNAIHCLIGEKTLSTDKLLEAIVQQVKEKGARVNSSKGVPISIADYLMQDSDIRFDNQSTNLVKRLLQRDIIDDSIRRDIIQKCLSYFTSITPSDHAKRLYLSVDQMQEMRKDGMYFGSHGLTHRWLNTLSAREQYVEISKSFDELERLGLISQNLDPRVMAFPFGAYNSETFGILDDQQVTYSLTTIVGAASGSLNDSSKYQLKRWDTNDFWNDRWRRPSIPCG